MPRRRNAPVVLIDAIETTEIEYDEKEPIRVVKDYLKNQVWDLIKAKPTDNVIECSICLDDICCKKCYTVLTCGHSYHLACVIKCKSCPLCRG